MKLKFHLLVIDDKPKSLSGAISQLERHLKTNGFELNAVYAEDLSKAGIKKLARQAGKEIDLVIVDYNLEQENFRGSEAAALLRRQFQFADMVFYSSDPGVSLLTELAARGVPGVLVSGRTDLPNYLTGVADTVIGKAVDLNHMRGIAMAEISEMDSIMDDALSVAFKKGNKKFEKEGVEIVENFVKFSQKRAKTAEELAGKLTVLEIVTNGKIFGSANKMDAIRKVAGTFQNSSSFKLLRKYNDEVLADRNVLAHVKETTNSKGETSLTHMRGKDKIIVDEDWLRAFRIKLAKYNEALTTVCNEIKLVK